MRIKSQLFSSYYNMTVSNNLKTKSNLFIRGGSRPVFSLTPHSELYFYLGIIGLHAAIIDVLANILFLNSHDNIVINIKNLPFTFVDIPALFFIFFKNTKN